MIKKLTPVNILVTAVVLACASTLLAQATKKKGGGGLPMVSAPRLSPHETTYVRVGTDRQSSALISVTYGRPYSAKGGKGEARKVWGNLVKWDKADRLGSDEATIIVTDHPLEIQGKAIPAGVSAMYIIPSESGTSQLAFSSNYAKWGIGVDESHDIARVDLKKEEIDEDVPQLTIVLENHGTSGLIKIRWEKTQFSVPFTVK